MNWSLQNWKSIKKDLNKLKDQLDRSLGEQGSKNSGDVAVVDYFALCHVIEFISDAKADIDILIQVRELVKRIRAS